MIALSMSVIDVFFLQKNKKRDAFIKNKVELSEFYEAKEEHK
jgi:hypothetical protein